MKKILLCLALLTAPVIHTSCTLAPSERVVQVQTLKAVGLTAKAAIDSAAILLANDRITVKEFNKVAEIYDAKFQSAFRLAVVAVQSDLSPASPELILLAAELSALIATYSSR